ncbi:MAG: hypothetical protein IK007_09480 [Lachnospiraceae bacterium]|nr:hypothetical protein [Lachnospiraceae bacterium]
MGKILKMDFRRLFKNPFFYAYPLAVMVIMIISMVTSKTDPEDTTHITMILEQAEGVLSMAIVAAGLVVIAHMSAFDKYGYSKNLVGNVNGRHMLTLSKLILGAFTMVFYAVANFLFMFGMMSHEVGKVIYMPKYPYPESADMAPNSLQKNWISREEWNKRISDMINHEIAHYVLMVVAGIAIIAMLIMLYELTRSSAFSYVMVILIGFGVIEEMIVSISGLIFPDLEIPRFLLISQFAYFNDYSSMSEDVGIIAADPVWTFWVKNLIYFAIFAGASLFISKKKDAA